ncbi:MAG: helix-turn-helix transcriptional regulator [Clostridiales bacterium]|nr:helix-turn-helix transcriptional regulator [Clostridiales bacterium]
MPEKSIIYANHCTRMAAYFTSAPGAFPVYTLQKVVFHANSTPLHEEIFGDGWYEITFQIRGTQRYEIEGNIYDLSAGQGLVCFPNERHSTSKMPFDKSTFYYMIFDLDKLFERLGATKEQSELLSHSFKEAFSYKRIFHFNDTLRKHFETLFELYEADTPFQETRLRNALSDFFISLIAFSEQKLPTTSSRMTPVLQYIQTHRDEYYPLSSLASLANLSLSRFSATFTAEFGLSPREYIIRDRIAQAKQLLCTSELSVTDIAMQLGFSSLQHFSGIFRKYTFMTPSQWRKQANKKQ